MEHYRSAFQFSEERKAGSAKIGEYRAAIDSIDEQIVELLNQRARHAHAIQQLKPEEGMPLYDPQREAQVFEHVEECNGGPLYNEQLRNIYAEILKIMKELRA